MIKVNIPNKYLDDTYDYLNDSDYYFNITPGDYSLDFQLCRLDDYQEEDILITGFLKWDGCCNWQTNPDCMYHFCGSNDAVKLAKLFEYLYSAGSKYISNWMD